MAAPSKTPEPLVTDKALSALLALVVADREERLEGDANGKPRKTELVLTTGGLTPQEIASLVGKNVDAVRKTIQRGRS